MIFKSYLLEQNLNILKAQIVLIYGENIGAIGDIKKKISLENYKNEIIKLTQDEILKNEQLLINEIRNKSLFENQKTIFVQNVDDKILKIIQEILLEVGENKVFLFASALEKKSKLRNFFESKDNLNIIPFYQDNETTIKRIISEELKDFVGLSTEVKNLLLNNCNNDRAKLKNEIYKIKNFFIDKSIDIKKLQMLLNYEEVEDFNMIKDAVLKGDKKVTNKLIDSTFIDDQKSILYLGTINNRLLKLKEVKKNSGKNIEKIINELKPPLFWKDKPIFLKQLQHWDEKRINLALSRTYKIEIIIKSNASVNKNVILKKFLIDICNLANAA